MISHLNEDLQDLIKGIPQFNTLKGWTLLAALQDTTAPSEQSHTREQLKLIYLYTYPPSTGICLSQNRQ